MKLEIKLVTFDDGYYDYKDKIVLYIDGEKIGEGYYGGEPEDNTRGRDYLWVEEVIKTVASRLGAEVTTNCETVTDQNLFYK